MDPLSKEERRQLRDYLVATILAFGTLQLCARMPPRFGNGNPYHLAWLAVFASAWYLGLGPSVLVFVVESLGVWYFFNPAPHGFHLVTRGAATDLTGFVLLSMMVIAFGEANRRTSAEWIAVESKIVARKRAARELQAINKALIEFAEPERRRVEDELRTAILTLPAVVPFGRNQLQTQKKTTMAVAQFEDALLAHCSDLPGDSFKEVRANPPLMRLLEPAEIGLESAVPCYVDGFSRRTGIPATAYVRPDFGRLPAEIEMALFRILQECLTNFHWHSGSATARVRLAKHDGIVTLEVEDESKGMALGPSPLLPRTPEISSAVLTGLTEHMRQLGGTLQVDASRGGTLVRAVVPYSPSAAQRAS